MENRLFTDEQLNLYIDNELAHEEMDEIRTSILDDNSLRERVCQLKAVRELVNYAYENVPEPHSIDTDVNSYGFTNLFKGVAAGLLIGIGVIVGWVANEEASEKDGVASATDVFQYFKYKAPADHVERKIVLHVTTGDIAAVDQALKEAEQLLASYERANKPMKLDIIANKEGINMLRVGVSPYIEKIENIIETRHNVSVYACLNSIEKAREREGQDIVVMHDAETRKTAQDLISDRLDKGWVYIKV